MKVVYVHTSDVRITKDVIIKAAIKAGMKYVEMENEVLVESALFRIVEVKERNNDISLIDILDKKICRKEWKAVSMDEEAPSLDYHYYPRRTKNDYKLEAKKVNDKVKIKQYYNRRRYQ